MCTAPRRLMTTSNSRGHAAAAEYSVLNSSQSENADVGTSSSTWVRVRDVHWELSFGSPSLDENNQPLRNEKQQPPLSVHKGALQHPTLCATKQKNLYISRGLCSSSEAYTVSEEQSRQPLTAACCIHLDARYRSLISPHISRRFEASHSMPVRTVRYVPRCIRHINARLMNFPGTNAFNCGHGEATTFQFHTNHNV
jgi:hypothetical protein